MNSLISQAVHARDKFCVFYYVEFTNVCILNLIHTLLTGCEALSFKGCQVAAQHYVIACCVSQAGGVSSHMSTMHIGAFWLALGAIQIRKVVLQVLLPPRVLILPAIQLVFLQTSN
jgi:hypothetical protein